MKILIGLTDQAQNISSEINFKDLGQKYLWKLSKLTKEYLFQASINPFDIFIISAEKLPFYSTQRNVELFRKKFFTPPLLIIGTNYNSSQRANLLKIGADDCLLSQVSSQELMAKIEVFARRPIRRHRNLIKHGPLVFDTQTKILSHQGKTRNATIYLKTAEIFLIEFFFKNKRQIISKHQILDKISNNNSSNPMNLAEVHIYSLRKKIKEQTGINIIETVRGFGYRLGDHFPIPTHNFLVNFRKGYQLDSHFPHQDLPLASHQVATSLFDKSLA